MTRGSLLGVVAALCVAASTSVQAQPAGNALPAGDGRDLLTAACTSCHGLTTIVMMRDGPAGWQHQVQNMVLRGAQLTGPELDTLVQYLAVNFGPGSPRPAGVQGAPVTLPDGDGKELIEVRCAVCHDLGRIAAIKRSKPSWDAIVANMVNRGATATPDEAKTIAAYLASKFGSN